MASTSTSTDALVSQLFSGDGLSESALLLFNSYDKDKSGALSNAEAEACLIALCRTVGKDITSKQIQLLIEENDVDNDNTLSLAEFVALLQDCFFGPSEEQLVAQKAAAEQTALTDEQTVALARQEAWSRRFDIMLKLATAFSTIADLLSKGQDVRKPAKEATMGLGKVVRTLHNNALVTTHERFFELQRQLIDVSVDLEDSSRGLMSALRRNKLVSAEMLAKSIQTAMLHMIRLSDNVRLFDQERLSFDSKSVVTYTPPQRALIKLAKDLFATACLMFETSIADCEGQQPAIGPSSSLSRLPSLSNIQPGKRTSASSAEETDPPSYDELQQSFLGLTQALDNEPLSSLPSSFIRGWKRACRRFEAKVTAYRLSKKPRYRHLFTARWQFFASVNGGLIKQLSNASILSAHFEDFLGEDNEDNASTAAAATTTTTTTTTTQDQQEQPRFPSLSSQEIESLTKLQRVVRRWLMRRHMSVLVDEYRVSDQAEKGRRRNQLLKEIMSTERTYMLGIEIMLKEYLQALVPLQPAFADQFTPLWAIHELHTQLLAELQKRYDAWTGSQIIADAFIDFLPRMLIYERWVNCYDELSAAVVELRATSPAVDAALRATQSHLGEAYSMRSAQPLESFLITPVQRLPRYVLLLKELKALTPKDHCDFANVEQAIEAATQLTHEINARKSSFENAKHVAQLQSKISGMPVSLMAPGRRIIKQGRLKVSVDGAVAAYNVVVLFNDAIIRLRQAPGSDSSQFLSFHSLKICRFEEVDEAKKTGFLRKARSPPFSLLVCEPGSSAFLVLKFTASDQLTRETWANELKSQINIYRISLELPRGLPPPPEEDATRT